MSESNSNLLIGIGVAPEPLLARRLDCQIGLRHVELENSSRNDGTAIATRMSTGTTVQTTSMTVLCVVREGTGLRRALKRTITITSSANTKSVIAMTEPEQEVVKPDDVVHHRRYALPADQAAMDAAVPFRRPVRAPRRQTSAAVPATTNAINRLITSIAECAPRRKENLASQGPSLPPTERLDVRPAPICHGTLPRAWQLQGCFRTGKSGPLKPQFPTCRNARDSPRGVRAKHYRKAAPRCRIYAIAARFPCASRMHQRPAPAMLDKGRAGVGSGATVSANSDAIRCRFRLRGARSAKDRLMRFSRRYWREVGLSFCLRSHVSNSC